MQLCAVDRSRAVTRNGFGHPRAQKSYRGLFFNESIALPVRKLNDA